MSYIYGLENLWTLCSFFVSRNFPKEPIKLHFYWIYKYAHRLFLLLMEKAEETIFLALLLFTLFMPKNYTMQNKGLTYLIRHKRLFIVNVPKKWILFSMYICMLHTYCRTSLEPKSNIVAKIVRTRWAPGLRKFNDMRFILGEQKVELFSELIK